MNPYARAYANNGAAAALAFRLYRKYYDDAPPPRVPGMDTVIRMAWRIECGHTIEEAACREYLYRWQLAIKSPDQAMLPHNSTLNPTVSIFGTPHAIGL